MYGGRTDYAVDDKGRVSLPNALRETLEQQQYDRVWVTNNYFWGEPFLAVYSPREWERTVGKIRQRPSFDPDMQLFQFFFIGGAQEAVLDRQGRVLIAQRLRTFAKLERNVTFSATTDGFQLWNREIVEKLLTAARERFSDPEFQRKLGI